MGITITQIKASEIERERIKTELGKIGREIYEIRTGDPLGSGFGFSSYSLQTYEGDHFWGQEGPDWGKGTPIISLEFYWSRAEEHIYITLPQAWLTEDYCALEAERVAAEKAELKRLADIEKENNRIAREASERATYARLKAKFEQK